jgi:diguanylate cyclase (GGDEF)-like protein/PAS domain S-box-containing protein
MSFQNPAVIGDYLDLLLDAICVVDKEGRFLYVGGAAERIFGYVPAFMLGRYMLDFVHPEDRSRTLGAVDRIMGGEPQLHFENRYLRANGDVVHLMWSARWSPERQYRVAVARDISVRKCAELKQTAVYAISEASHMADDLPALYGHIHQIISRLLPVSQFSIALYDEARGQVTFPYHAGDVGSAAVAEDYDSADACAQVIRNDQSLLLTSVDTQLVNHSWLGVPLRGRKGVLGALVIQNYNSRQNYTDADKELLQYVSTQIANAIERKQVFAHLQHLALYDPLTDLPNRGLFHDRMQQALARARRNQGQLALFFLDLDKFKDINDTHGHSLGDELLIQVARRLESCVRESDTIARFGGDEFVVLLENLQNIEQSRQFASTIYNALSQPMALGDISLQIFASIGIAHFPADAEDMSGLLNHADEAMYSLKKRNRSLGV